MTDELYFLTRYAPFWSIPTFLIGSELAYLFWLRKKKKYASISFAIVLLCLFVTCFYYWAGGPEKSVVKVKSAVRYYLE